MLPHTQHILPPAPPPPSLPNMPSHIQPSVMHSVQPNRTTSQVQPPLQHDSSRFPLPPGAPPPPFILPGGVPMPLPPAPVIQPSTQQQQQQQQQPQQQQQQQQQQGDTQRCQQWPACQNSSCKFAHPKEMCKNFPNCLYGKNCLYIHPPCMLGDLCTDVSCLFMHISTKTIPPKADPPKKEPTRPCSFGVAGKQKQTMLPLDTPQLLK